MIVLGDRERPNRAMWLFAPTLSTTIVGCGAAAAALLFLSYETRHTALVAPVNPQFRAIMASIGAFAGVWIAAIVRDIARGDNARTGRVANTFWAPVKLAGLVVLGGCCGAYAAELATEWRAFHGLRPDTRSEVFTVVDFRFGPKGPDWLELRASPSTASFRINCGLRHCRGIAVGDRLPLSIETGRGGVERAVLPNYPYSQVLRR